ncbi:cation efflux system protein [Neoasaia chiangmaiensis NBRC 101099]|uniref:Cobalt transporter n=1 Tax=Neoasaia chiangmaiensis TaxID=320497 RepID=A0A1U9KQJ6_9PROT|nr:cation diffusion facilitator family transporter [Neoasaia chiangmaiensis]AQS88078.1 cobalt transporter [Neoasaia chiangmaiensis]GBR38732.1 cation efflux system protein [Neoasaia chiangmaiensis NBRC 101099]GEN15758.1 cobalt transporter [Neoasaia chiangmaiensis]
MHHHHHHHHHHPTTYGSAFAIGIALNVAYILAEVIWGVWAHSLSLLSDAGHNLSDVLGLGGAWLAQHLAARAPSARFTYGLRRSTILSALGNAVLLLLVTGGIVWEAVQRLVHPAPVAGMTVMVVAFAGIVINGATALLLMRDSHHDLNMRGAFLHMASDALMSFAVVVTGLVIMLTRWTVLDPIVSLVVSGVIVWGTWSLLRKSLDMALDAVPARIDPAAVDTALRGLTGVADVHHLHIWSLSTTETALTVHLVVDESLTTDNALLHTATHMLMHQFDIAHPTFQVERGHCATHASDVCAVPHA